MATRYTMPFSRRTVLGRLAGVAVGAILTACSGNAATIAPAATTRPGGTVGNTIAPMATYPPPVPASTTVTIAFESYTLAAAGPIKDGTDQLIAEFMAANPNIKVQGRPYPNGDISKVQAEVVAGNPPDLLQGTYGDFDFIVNDLKATALEDLVSPAELSAWKGGEFPINPKALRLSELNGKTYGVAFSISNHTLFYNADLFTAAGLDPAKPPTTWAETKQYALQIKQRTGKEGVFITSIGGSDWSVQALMRSNGGRVLSEDRKTVTFAQPDAVAAVQMWQDLVQSGAHPPLNWMEGGTAFSGGNLGMILTTSAFLSSYVAASKGKWTLKTAKMPAFAGKSPVTLNSGSGAFILAKDPLKQRASWEFAKFLTSERGFTIITSKIGYLPLRTGIVNDDRYLKQWVAANPLVLPTLEQIDIMEPWVAWPGTNYRQAADLTLKAVEQVTYSGANADMTLKVAQDRVQQLLPRS